MLFICCCVVVVFRLGNGGFVGALSTWLVVVSLLGWLDCFACDGGLLVC